ncbi:MAG: SAM-dependent chlorinase/fluorinase [Thermogutta sp.]|nr:SAM-dependent chlorinase/fluorinase [Thermogutta sp.]HOP77746.1 SAM-dependent chlorinase/fluorinase [Thermogutta sp.]HPU07318.1 SAM-dependent chlorinase/fluorinase [Thermogutta sp.]HQF13141.1 SAM-dependent chlorinase/fluorinase [Thermogutta sp.]
MTQIVTLITDFGWESVYVAQMKAVLLSINRRLTIVDVTHEIPPQDVQAGALVLRHVVPSFPPGSCHVAVVDPGVGTQRPCLCADMGGRYVVAPDNGLITYLAEVLPVNVMVRLENPAYRLPEVSATFHGRDVMAPAAAWLSLGVTLEQLGPVHHAPVLLPEGWKPLVTERQIRGKVVLVDRFGNLITNIEKTHLSPDRTVTVSIGEYVIPGLVRTYGHRTSGEVVALINSQGYVEVAVVNGSAAEVTGLGVGTPVVITW